MDELSLQVNFLLSESCEKILVALTEETVVEIDTFLARNIKNKTEIRPKTA